MEEERKERKSSVFHTYERMLESSDLTYFQKFNQLSSILRAFLVGPRTSQHPFICIFKKYHVIELLFFFGSVPVIYIIAGDIYSFYINSKRIHYSKLTFCISLIYLKDCFLTSFIVVLIWCLL